jgi:hypothetical protein
VALGLVQTRAQDTDIGHDLCCCAEGMGWHRYDYIDVVGFFMRLPFRGQVDGQPIAGDSGRAN